MNSIKLPEECEKQWEVLLLLLLSEEKKINRCNETEVEVMSYFMKHVGVKKIMCEWLKRMHNTYGTKMTAKDTATKSDAVSLLWRLEGNEYFYITNIEESYRCYTLSLIYAVTGGQMFALAAANRSAALLKLGRFEDCLGDIELALKYDYPMDQRHKLLLRRADCHVELHQLQEARVSLEEAWQHAHNFARLSPNSDFERHAAVVAVKLERGGGPTPWQAAERLKVALPEPIENERFVNACGALELRRAERVGRHVVTREATAFGQVLFTEEAYACVALPAEGGVCVTVCERCCCRELNPVPCGECSRAVYCGEACRDAAWSANHRWECVGARARLWPTIGIAHLALRVLLEMARRGLPPPPPPPGPAAPAAPADPAAPAAPADPAAPAEPLTAAELFARYSSLDNIEIYKADTPAFYRMFHLVTNFDKMNNEDLIQYALTATMITLYLEEYTGFFGEWSVTAAAARAEERPLLAAALTLRALGQLVSNGHAALSFTLCADDEGRTVTERQVRHATAIYPSVAMMNHSCDPNVVNTFHGSRLIVRGARALAAGVEVVNCYGPHRAREPAATRRALLWAQYRFECACDACEDPLRKDSVLAFGAFACAVCRGPARGVCAQCRTPVDPERCSAVLRAAVEQEKRALEAWSRQTRMALMTSAFELRQQVWHRHHSELRRAADRLARHMADVGEFIKSIELIKQNVQTLEYQFGSFSAEVGNELRKLGDVMMERICQYPTHPDYREWCKEVHKILKKTYLLMELNYGGWEPLVRRVRTQEALVRAALEQPDDLSQRLHYQLRL